MNTKIVPVIWCGGSGTRMSPESHESLPEQIHPLIGQRSSLSDDCQRRPRSLPCSIRRSSSPTSKIAFRALARLREIADEAVIVLEPDRRDSAAVGALPPGRRLVIRRRS